MQTWTSWGCKQILGHLSPYIIDIIFVRMYHVYIYIYIYIWAFFVVIQPLDGESHY